MFTAMASGIVVAGHGVASGRSSDPRFPGGTIALQVPVFLDRGVDLTDLLGASPFLGTINVDMSPAAPSVIAPEIAVPAVTWSTRVPPENFWLFRAGIAHAAHLYPALIYMPDPATKPDHVQPATVIEIIAPWVPALVVGDTLGVATDQSRLRFDAAIRSRAGRPPS